MELLMVTGSKFLPWDESEGRGGDGCQGKERLGGRKGPLLSYERMKTGMAKERVVGSLSNLLNKLGVRPGAGGA